MGEHMKTKKILKISTLIIAGSILLNMNQTHIKAATVPQEHSLSGITDRIDRYFEKSGEKGRIAPLSYVQYERNIPEKNLGVSNVDNYLNIRKGPGTNYTAIGKLPKHAGCTILSEEDGWYKIKSGRVTGYVSAEYLITGNEAQSMADKLAKVYVNVVDSGLRLREAPSTESKIYDVLGAGEQFEVDTEIVENPEDPVATRWVKVKMDSEDGEEYGYLAYDYVRLTLELEKAVPVEDLSNNTSTSAKIIETAKKYLGNRYVYGGTSLTGGIDCSAFVQQIYAMYGYRLPRTSRAQATCGTPVSSGDARRGDLVFYAKGGTISHVAICMGNGMIIHASNKRDGVKISNMYYRTPAKIVRILR